jgi:hypothetical protein
MATQPAFSDSISPPPHPALSPKQMRESLLLHLEACVLYNDWEGSCLSWKSECLYLGVASKDCLTHKVGEVEGVADQGTPTEEVGQAQPPARRFFTVKGRLSGDLKVGFVTQVWSGLINKTQMIKFVKPFISAGKNGWNSFMVFNAY